MTPQFLQWIISRGGVLTFCFFILRFGPSIYPYPKKLSGVSSTLKNYLKGVRALRGYFGPHMRSKIKVALHKFLLINQLEQ